MAEQEEDGDGAGWYLLGCDVNHRARWWFAD